MRKSDVFPALFWLALGIVVVTISSGLKLGTLRSPGPGLMPFLLGALLVVAALPILAGAIGARSADGAHGAWTFSGLRNPALITACISGYALGLDALGFLAATFLFLLALLKFLERSRWMGPLAIAAIAALIAYVVFVRLLDVELPAGTVWKVVQLR